ncbi:MAG: hypothetical protein KUL77_08360 [Thermomonas sp.]|uniref:hypothetical protein n=1 Tax=Thermomonas sp. TaxID=1971895 RepID=UPI001EB38415|nr:hypothetical protein [Thermomonas sp.]MBV2209559.1 hypothetical protein [Thermomonas sp.]
MPWSDSTSKWLLFIACLLLSALGTWTARGYALRRKMLDQPGERRSHTQPTPRGGGIGLVVVTLMLLLMLAQQAPVLWGGAALGLLLVAGIGWWDDHHPLSALSRLIVQVCAGGIFAASVAVTNGDLWLVGAAFIAVPVLVNVWNFMDGINGMAASQATLAALALACLLSGVAQLVALAVAAAALGFLPFNFPRARIFLGDVGSGGLGFLMAMLLVFSMQQHTPSMWPVLFLPVSAMLADSGITLLWRMRRGERWWEPHTQHLYQKLARRYGHVRVSISYAMWTIMAGLSMQLAVSMAAGWSWLVTILFAAVTLKIWVKLHSQ